VEAQIQSPIFPVFIYNGATTATGNHSNLHFSKGSDYDFTIHKRRPKTSRISVPSAMRRWIITIPQNSYRIGGLSQQSAYLGYRDQLRSCQIVVNDARICALPADLRNAYRPGQRYYQQICAS